MSFAKEILKRINELFGENTFTHEGHQYDLPSLNKLIKDYPVKDFKISDLDWIFKYDDPEKDDPNRIKSAWLSLPIIVIDWKNKLVVLDGLHRLKKAQLQEHDTIRGRLVTITDLKKVEVS